MHGWTHLISASIIMPISTSISTYHWTPQHALSLICSYKPVVTINIAHLSLCMTHSMSLFLMNTISVLVFTCALCRSFPPFVHFPDYKEICPCIVPDIHSGVSGSTISTSLTSTVSYSKSYLSEMWRAATQLIHRLTQPLSLHAQSFLNWRIHSSF
jgi:hypothetical protein